MVSPQLPLSPWCWMWGEPRCWHGPMDATCKIFQSQMHGPYPHVENRYGPHILKNFQLWVSNLHFCGVGLLQALRVSALFVNTSEFCKHHLLALCVCIRVFYVLSGWPMYASLTPEECLLWKGTCYILFYVPCERSVWGRYCFKYTSVLGNAFKPFLRYFHSRNSLKLSMRSDQSA